MKPKERLNKYNNSLYMILISLAERKDIGKKLEEVVTLFKKFPELQNDDFFESKKQNLNYIKMKLKNLKEY